MPRRPSAPASVNALQAASAADSPRPDSDSPFVRAYLRFLARVSRAEHKACGADAQTLDPNETALLELLVLRWARQEPLTVRQAIAHAHMGSPATLHKRVMQLRQKGFIELQDVPGDRRAKFLIPGPEGLAHLERMGRHLLGARRAALPGAAPD